MVEAAEAGMLTWFESNRGVELVLDESLVGLVVATDAATPFEEG